MILLFAWILDSTILYCLNTYTIYYQYGWKIDLFVYFLSLVSSMVSRDFSNQSFPMTYLKTFPNAFQSSVEDFWKIVHIVS